MFDNVQEMVEIIAPLLFVAVLFFKQCWNIIHFIERWKKMSLSLNWKRVRGPGEQKSHLLNVSKMSSNFNVISFVNWEGIKKAIVTQDYFLLHENKNRKDFQTNWYKSLSFCIVTNDCHSHNVISISLC